MLRHNFFLRDLFGLDDRGRRGAKRGHLIPQGLCVKGDLVGDENLLVDGRVEGSIHLEDHDVTIAGEVHGNVHAKCVTVLGQVHGDLVASDLVELRETASVRGNVKARRFKIVEDATLDGGIRTFADDEAPNLKLVQDAAPASAESSVQPDASTSVADPLPTPEAPHSPALPARRPSLPAAPRFSNRLPGLVPGKR